MPERRTLAGPSRVHSTDSHVYGADPCSFVALSAWLTGAQGRGRGKGSADRNARYRQITAQRARRHRRGTDRTDPIAASLTAPRCWA